MLTQEMNVLTREIATGNDARMAALAHLRKSGRAERDARMAAMAHLRKALRAEFAKIRPGLARSEAARAADVKARLRAITADRAGAHEAWRNLTVTLHGKRVAAAASARKPTATSAQVATAAQAEPAKAE